MLLPAPDLPHAGTHWSCLLSNSGSAVNLVADLFVIRLGKSSSFSKRFYSHLESRPLMGVFTSSRMRPRELSVFFFLYSFICLCIYLWFMIYLFYLFIYMCIYYFSCICLFVWSSVQRLLTASSLDAGVCLLCTLVNPTLSPQYHPSACYTRLCKFICYRDIQLNHLSLDHRLRKWISKAS